MSCCRLWIAVPLLFLAPCAGCQPLAPGASQSLAGSAGGADDRVLQRDDDSFTGRLATGTRQVTDAASKPLDPTYWQQAQQASQAKKRLKQQQAAAAKQRQQSNRSPLMSWLFPEPKQPRTLSEWLSQERPET